eukprot:scaffold161112_cov33-Prasinocladus_malaysianus.AAC.1
MKEADLGCADVGSCLVAADVLLAGLHGHAQGRGAGGVHADADDAAGHEALIVLRRGQESRVWATIPEEYIQLGECQ